MAERSHHMDFDELMRVLTMVGFVALASWVMTSSVGVITGYVAVSPPATLRFLLAVLIVVFARRTYWELREWRWGKLPPDERFGFSNPLSDHLPPGATGSDEPAPRGDAAEPPDASATGSSRAPA